MAKPDYKDIGVMICLTGSKLLSFLRKMESMAEMIEDHEKNFLNQPYP